MQEDRFGWGRAPQNTNLAQVAEQPAGLAAVRQKYLRDWTIVKRARFNAAKRLERKNAASVLAFAVAGTIGFVVPYFTLLFSEQMSAQTHKSLDLMVYITGGLSVGVGLVEQAKNYLLQAQRFHTCGLRVNEVVRLLRNRPVIDEGALNDLVGRYEQALKDCDGNHDDVDRDIAEVQQAIAESREAAVKNGEQKSSTSTERARLDRKLNAVKRRELLHIYWLYAAIWFVPPLMAALTWWFV